MKKKAAKEVRFGDLRLVWLEAFVQCAQTGKRTAAATEMGIEHQGTVTKHIQKLEAWVGGTHSRPLMVDNSSPVMLTSEGERLLPLAQQVLELLGEARKRPDLVETPPRPRVSARDIKVPKI